MNKKVFINWAVRLSSVAAVAIIAGNLGTQGAAASAHGFGNANHQQALRQNLKNNQSSPSSSANGQSVSSSKNDSASIGSSSDNQVNDNSNTTGNDSTSLNNSNDPSVAQANSGGQSNDPSVAQSTINGQSNDPSSVSSGVYNQQASGNGGFYPSGGYRSHTRTRAS
ncbi:hypothetical protein LSG31_11930 [Fodinisporobacter ferrooxydans]|uniref:Uncharacterized protein n=1 Tax=Fodinisporobacter ferrooxydans TaxID=2901836 RepID=A0ABY4CDQ2_9BACL|nr:hypothetical protein LSG31_11930 [Alicyclobacillaceae bacterium MYW30-H2]